MPASTTGSHRATSQKCYERLRWMLMCSQLAPGVRLAEMDWSSRLGVHRAAVREAMAMLAHEGLLRRGAKGGFFVPTLEIADINEIWESRIVIEVGALRLLGEKRLQREALKPLAAICDTMQHLLESDMFMGFVEADRKYHDKTVELCGNKRLLAIYRHSALPHFLFPSQDPDAWRSGLQPTIDEHRQIHEFLVADKIPEAIRVLEGHLRVGMYRMSLVTQNPK
ncbi:MAG: GntR family transcriptional regulator [Rhodopirellula sp.]|nr:GntR family transcriptional regulator [Rhodopirellula sp.]